MPTAKSAAASPFASQPKSSLKSYRTAKPGRARHLALAGLGVLLGLGVIVPVEMLNAPAVAAFTRPNNCGGWNSTTRPPDYIRVLRRRSGRVERVPFRKYVVTVLGKEWPSYLPYPVVQAGAVAVKQYAWYHALGKGRMASNGQCFDVRDGTGDQLYKPNKARVRPDHYNAVDSTWGVRLLKHGQLFMTGYRRGNKGNCGHDATGWKLYARSATRCANRGYGYQQILRTYYGPGLDVVGSGSANLSGSSAQLFSGQSSTEPAPEATAQPAPESTTAPETDSAAKPAAPRATDLLVVDDSSKSISWSGTWQRVRQSSADGSTMTCSGLAGSSATFQFVGRGFELLGRRGPDRGWIDVYIDGVKQTRVDLLAATSEGQSTIFSQQWPEAATRSVEIVVVGAANRSGVDLDGITVQP